jgi:hypothetical protein
MFISPSNFVQYLRKWKAVFSSVITYVGDAPPGSLELGETSTTAYRGDRGKTAYDHSQTTHAPSGATVGADWNTNLSNIPASFTPSAHNQAATTITEDSTHRFVTDSEKGTWGGKQDALVSGANIKTINSASVLGSGNLVVSGALPEAIIGKLSPANYVAITAGYYFIIPEQMEIALNHEIEIGLGSVLAII